MIFLATLFRLLWGTVAHSFRLLGFPGRALGVLLEVVYLDPEGPDYPLPARRGDLG